MQKMSNVENIESKLSTTDEDEINEDPMIESENFEESYNLDLLFGDSKDDNRDTEVSSDTPSASELNDSSTSNGGTSQDACLEEVKADSEKETEELRAEKIKSLQTLANNAFKTQAFEEALKYINEAILLMPNDPTLYIDRAGTYIELCLYQKAIEECEVVLQFSEYYLKPWLYMAKAYFMLGDNALSKEYIREAIARNPEELWEIQSYEEDFRYADIS